MFRSLFRPLRTALLTLLTAALGASALAGCSGDESDEPGAAPTSEATSPAAPAVATTVRFGTVSGRLAPAERTRLRSAVTRAVDAWIDGAYVGGDYPRSDFDDAFTSFTPGARERALDDLALMSNAGVGERVEEVEVLRRTLRIDVLAPRGGAAGVTASVGLGIRLTGDVERRDRIAGDLYLTKADGDGGDWLVFGYDVQRGEV